jgi:hypothetical protein
MTFLVHRKNLRYQNTSFIYVIRLTKFSLTSRAFVILYLYELIHLVKGFMGIGLTLFLVEDNLIIMTALKFPKNDEEELDSFNLFWCLYLETYKTQQCYVIVYCIQNHVNQNGFFEFSQIKEIDESDNFTKLSLKILYQKSFKTNSSL